MHRCHGDACRAQRLEFAAEQRSAGVESNTRFALTFILRSILIFVPGCVLITDASGELHREIRSRTPNNTVGDAEPQQGGVQRGGMCGDGLCTDLHGEIARSVT